MSQPTDAPLSAEGQQTVARLVALNRTPELHAEVTALVRELEQAQALAAHTEGMLQTNTSEMLRLHDVLVATRGECDRYRDRYAAQALKADSLRKRADAAEARLAALRVALKELRLRTQGFAHGSWKSQLNAVAARALAEPGPEEKA